MRIFFLIFSFVVFTSPNAQELVTVKYAVEFNQQFDQPGSDIRRLTGFLKVFDAVASDFFMTADTKAPDLENSINLDGDTVWRVKTDLETQQMFFEDLFNSGMKSQWYADTLFNMKWSVENVESVIDSMVCLRAHTIFRGRQYYAWFCPEISLPFGPWKLGGLPGLIVDMSDIDGNLRIKATSIERSQGQRLSVPANAKMYKDYLREGIAMRKIIRESARATDCIDCESKVKFRSWEKVFAE